MKKIIFQLLSVFFLVFFALAGPIGLTGCGSSSSVTATDDTTTDDTTTDDTTDDATGNDATSDTTAPTISSTSPVNAATGVSNASSLNITVTFSENVTGVNDTTFTVVDGNAASVAGTVTYSESNFTATFTPTSALALLATHTITIASTIADAAGNILGTDQTITFTTRDGSFGTPGDIDNTGGAETPQIGIDNSGNATFVWIEDDGEADSVFMNDYSVSTSTWGSATLVDSGGEDATNPQISVSPDGNIMTAWTQSDGDHVRVYSNQLDDGWENTDTAIIEEQARASSAVQIAAGSTEAVAVWVLDGALADQVLGNFFDVATNWTTSDNTAISSGAIGDATVPQIGVDSDANAHVVWVNNGGVDDAIYANYLTNDLLWSAETQEDISSEIGSGDASAPQIATDTSGNAIAVWVRDGGLYYNTATDGTWGSPAEIDAELVHTEPQISMNESGEAIIVSVANGFIRALFYDGAGSLSSMQSLRSGGVAIASSPQAAIDAHGNALVVWKQDDNGIYYSRYSAIDSSWTDATQLDDDTGVCLTPQIAMDINGNAVVVWEQTNSIYGVAFQ